MIDPIIRQARKANAIASRRQSGRGETSRKRCVKCMEYYLVSCIIKTTFIRKSIGKICPGCGWFIIDGLNDIEFVVALRENNTTKHKPKGRLGKFRIKCECGKYYHISLYLQTSKKLLTIGTICPGCWTFIINQELFKKE